MSEDNTVDPLVSAERRHVPFLELLDIRPVAAQKGHATFEMLIEHRHLRTLGILHGGVTATLLDTAMGYAAGTLSPSGYFVVTVQLNVNFIRPGWEGETLRVSGDVKHSGQQTAVSYGEIRNAEGTLVATGTGTFLYIKQPADSGDALSRHEDGAPEKA